MKNFKLNLDKSFKNKKIIVTGSSRGLGLETCKILASKGALLAMLSRSNSEMLKLKKKFHNSSKHICIETDLQNNPNINNSFLKAKKFLKSIDIIIHIAGGGLGLKKPLLKSFEITKLLQLNLLSIVELNRLAIEHKKKSKSLKLIHVGSITSYEGVGSVGYNTAKAALAAYVRSLGREVYKENIIVTGIMPGGFIAEGNSMYRLKENNINAYKKFINERLPRKKMGTVDEIIPMLLFLCSDFSSMMGGCMVPIDAGEGKSYAN